MMALTMNMAFGNALVTIPCTSIASVLAINPLICGDCNAPGGSRGAPNSMGLFRPEPLEKQGDGTNKRAEGQRSGLTRVDLGA
jgi:hypothetical protein